MEREKKKNRLIRKNGNGENIHKRDDAYFPHSEGGLHAHRSMSDLALGRQFLTTKYFVVNLATPTSL